MDLHEIEDLIIELLAAEIGRDVDDYREEITEAGELLPCDSVVAVEIMVKVEKRCGIQLELDTETAKAMRSVKSFALLVSRCRATSMGATELALGAPS